MKHLVLIGAGGHGAVVADSARLSGWTIVAVLAEDGTGNFEGIAVEPLARFESLAANPGIAVHVAIGNAAARLRLGELATRHRLALASIVHPQASVSPRATLGAGCFVAAGAVVAARARLAAQVIVNHRASVDHDALIGEGVHLAPGVTLGGHVEIGAATWVGIGSTVRDRIAIGARSFIGAGSLVLRDIPDDTLAYGSPARSIRALSGSERPYP